MRHFACVCVCVSSPPRFPEPPATYPPPPSCPYTQLKQWYWLDFASVLPPLLLGVAPHHVVLDMCAAPGGKSLVLAMQLLLGQEQEQGQTVLDGCAGTDDAHAEARVSDDGSSPRRPAAAVGQEQGLTHQWLQQLDLNAGTQAGAVPHHQQQQQELLQAPAAAAAGVNGLQQQPQQDSSGNPAGSNQAAAAEAEQQMMGEQEAEGQQAEEDEQEEEDWPPPAAVNSTSSTPGRLVCNELDPVRRQRLSGVLATYLPGSLRRRVRVTGHDAAHHWAR